MFYESCLNDDINNIQLAGFTLHRQDRTAIVSNTRGGGLCIFVINSWCTKSNSKEVSRFCLAEVEYLMTSCRPHYLPREFVYLPPQTNAGTKTATNELHMAISKQEKAHPEAALLVAGDFNAGNLNPFYLISTRMLCGQQEEEKNSRPPLLHTQKRVQSTPSPSM